MERVKQRVKFNSDRDEERSNERGEKEEKNKGRRRGRLRERDGVWTVERYEDREKFLEGKGKERRKMSMEGDVEKVVLRETERRVDVDPGVDAGSSVY